MCFEISYYVPDTTGCNYLIANKIDHMCLCIFNAYFNLFLATSQLDELRMNALSSQRSVLDISSQLIELRHARS